MVFYIAAIVLALFSLTAYGIQFAQLNSQRCIGFCLQTTLITLFILVPGVVYVLNLDTMVISLSFLDYSILFFAIAAPFFAITSLIGTYFNRIIRPLALICCNLILYAYVRAIFYPNSSNTIENGMGLLKSPLAQNPYNIIENAALFWVIACIISAQPVAKLLRYIKVVGITAICLMGYNISISPVSYLSDWVPTLFTEDIQNISVSSTNNVFILLFDGAASPYFYDTVWKDKSKQLDGFTFYVNTTGVGRNTMLSIPYIFSGKPLPGKDVLDLFAQSTHDNIFKDFSGTDYSSEIVNADEYNAFCGTYSHCLNQPKIHIAALQHFLYYVYLRIKPVNIDNTPQNSAENLIDIQFSWPSMFKAVAYFHDFLNRLKVSTQEKRLIFYPNFITHFPVFYNADCKFVQVSALDNSNRSNRLMAATSCSGNLIAEFIERLKKLGIYDNSTIIIMSDHGMIMPPKQYDVFHSYAPAFRIENKYQGFSFPLLLIKTPGAHGPGIISTIPASLLDIRPTLCKIAHNCPANLPGTDLLAPVDPDRTRTILNYTLAYTCYPNHNDCLKHGKNIMVKPDLSDFPQPRKRAR